MAFSSPKTPLEPAREEPSLINHSTRTTISKTKTPKAFPTTSSSPAQLLLQQMEPPTTLFPSRLELLRLLGVVAIATTVAVTCNYVATSLSRHPNPFCDTDFDLSSDSCEPCPSYGDCHDGKLECVSGYRKVGKSCIEDGDINETAKKLTELVERHVCESYAHFLCDGAGAAWIQESKLWNDLAEYTLQENPRLDDAVYAYAKQRALETTGKTFESRASVEGVRELKCPDMLVENYKSLSCLVREGIANNAVVLVPLCALVIVGTWILLRLRQRFYLSSRAEQLYSQVCDILEEHALISRNPNGEGEPWVVASWLRDHLLLPKERKNPILWRKVEELVQEDSRLDRYPKLVKGESKVVWEWQVEGSLSSLKKRKKAGEIKLKASEDIPSPKQHFWGLKTGELLKS